MFSDVLGPVVTLAFSKLLTLIASQFENLGKTVFGDKFSMSE